MIKFHHFIWRADFMRMHGLRVDRSADGAVRCCHVYSDVSTEELLAWGRDHSVPASWLHRSRLAHFDFWGRWLDLCDARGVPHKVFVADARSALGIPEA